MKKKHKIIISVTGASGAIYAKVLFDKLLQIKNQIEKIGVVMSDNAKYVWFQELSNKDYKNYPFDFSTLLLSQVSVMRLTAEAILEKSKDKALKALLADPVVNNVTEAEKLLNHMIEKQYQHLGYLI